MKMNSRVLKGTWMFNSSLFLWSFSSHPTFLFNERRRSCWGTPSFFDTPLSSLTWHWKIPIFNRKYIFKWWIFQCHVSFWECNTYRIQRQTSHPKRQGLRYAQCWEFWAIWHPVARSSARSWSFLGFGELFCRKVGIKMVCFTQLGRQTFVDVYYIYIYVYIYIYICMYM